MLFETQIRGPARLSTGVPITLKQIELRNGTDSTVEIGGAGDIFLGASIANASGTSAGKLKKVVLEPSF